MLLEIKNSNMAKNKAILDRIQSVELTKQITQTMKMVAASSLEKTKKKADHIRAYQEKLEATFLDLFPIPKGWSHPLMKKKTKKKRLLVVVGTDKGMCGSFLQTTLSEAVEEAKRKSEYPTDILPIGKKVLLFCEKKNISHLNQYTNLQSNLNHIFTLSPRGLIQIS